MASLTLSMSEELKAEVKHLNWVNWSEIAREEALKKAIFQSYMKTRNLTDEEWKFCERIEWHPVDELLLKEGFKKELEKRKKGPFLRYKSVEDLFKHRIH